MNICWRVHLCTAIQFSDVNNNMPEYNNSNSTHPLVPTWLDQIIYDNEWIRHTYMQYEKLHQHELRKQNNWYWSIYLRLNNARFHSNCSLTHTHIRIHISYYHITSRCHDIYRVQSARARLFIHWKKCAHWMSPLKNKEREYQRVREREYQRENNYNQKSNIIAHWIFIYHTCIVA